VRVLGFPIESPQTFANRIASDVASIARLARSAPGQLDRMLELGEEIAEIGRGLLEVAERLDRRAEAVMELGERLDRRAGELLDMGGHMQALGEQVDARGAEIADRASAVVQTGGDLIAVLPTLERALDLATPLEGAIDRFGRFVDRLPGGQRARPGAATTGTTTTGTMTTDAGTAPPADGPDQPG
jgi:hypothetical protein